MVHSDPYSALTEVFPSICIPLKRPTFNLIGFDLIWFSLICSESFCLAWDIYRLYSVYKDWPNQPYKPVSKGKKGYHYYFVVTWRTMHYVTAHWWLS